MRPGITPRDIPLMNRLIEEGLTASEISKKMRIVESCIESFMPEPEVPKPRRRRTKQEELE